MTNFYMLQITAHNLNLQLHGSSSSRFIAAPAAAFIALPAVLEARYIPPSFTIPSLTFIIQGPQAQLLLRQYHCRNQTTLER